SAPAQPWPSVPVPLWRKRLGQTSADRCSPVTAATLLRLVAFPLSLRRRRGLPFSSFSSTGARSHCLIKRRTLPSTTRIRTHAISLSCGIAVEAAFHIRVINRAAPVHQILPNDFQRVVRTPPGSKPIRAIQKVRFKDRFQDQHYRCLHHPITQVRDAQWP